MAERFEPCVRDLTELPLSPGQFDTDGLVQSPQTPVDHDRSFLIDRSECVGEIPKIITADCSFPKEIDDGLFVTPLDEDHELYRVGVCVADTSSLYKHPEVVLEAHERTAARYWDLPDGERGYDPMIQPDLIKRLEFTAGNVRSALVISFLVGPEQAPGMVDISFGQVEVTHNKNYKDFAKNALYGEGERFLRASQLIIDHLGYVAYGDHAGHRPAWRNPNTVSSMSEKAWKAGSKINESFMVAANHLVGKTLAEEGRPAIYRVHDPENEQYLELLSANVARYSRTPGPHSGLNLDPYCRVTSPLRRLDDFVMNRQLRLRFLGHPPTTQDTKDVAFAVRRLNQELVASAPKDASRFSQRDILGKAAVNGLSTLRAAG